MVLHKQDILMKKKVQKRNNKTNLHHTLNLQSVIILICYDMKYV